jgi:glycosyltransferase involved in cell wall biosynthesis
VTNERGIVCTPGDVDEFVAAVACLVNNPELSAALGLNARVAAQTEFTWDRHVERLFRHIMEQQ